MHLFLEICKLWRLGDCAFDCGVLLPEPGLNCLGLVTTGLVKALSLFPGAKFTAEPQARAQTQILNCLIVHGKGKKGRSRTQCAENRFFVWGSR